MAFNGQVTLPASLFWTFSNIKTYIIMKEKFSKWMSRNNMTFSAIAGETFTNAEVVYTHIGLVVFIIIAGVVGSF